MTQQLLKTLITYDSETGAITRLVPTTNRQYVGERVTDLTITFYDRTYSTTRIIYMYVLGNWPAGPIVLIDGTTSLLWSNLYCLGTYDNTSLTQARVQEFLTYLPSTGEFYWKRKPTKTTIIGSLAGSVSGTAPDGGYVFIRLFNKAYAAHRLAWLYVYGNLPDKQIDHIDHDRTNNAIHNLREADNHINMKNKSMYQTNKSGYTGVEQHGLNWKARIGVNGTKVLLGVFVTYEEAVAARKAAEKLLSYHNNHGLQKSNDYPAGSTSQAYGDGNSEDLTQVLIQSTLHRNMQQSLLAQQRRYLGLRLDTNITHEIKARQEFTDTSLNASFREIHEGFFTDKEITALIEGKDFWMGKDEVERRWENRKNYIRPIRAIAEASTKPKRGRPPRA